jgi:hypothetical protein
MLQGCKKDGKDLSEVTFANQVSKQVMVDIYPTLKDYANNTNRTARLMIDGNSKKTLPGSTFLPGQNYYMDWYTADQSFSNWFNDKFKDDIGYVTIEPTEGNNTYYMTPTFEGRKKIVFLDTTQTFTEWKPVDIVVYSASTGYVSVWNQTPQAWKDRSVTIRKDFTATHDYKDEFGTAHTEELAFKVHETKEAYIEFMDDTRKSLGYMMSGRLPSGTPPEYTATTADTVMALLPHSEYTYIMVRQ